MTAEQITVGRWSEDQFLKAATPWGELLARSEADPLFLSWDWLQAWWAAHAGPHELELRVFAAFAGKQLVGIAPLVAARCRTRAGFVSFRYQWLGQLFRTRSSAMSEHLDFIVDPERRAEIGGALLEAILEDGEWDELTLGNVLIDESLVGSLMARVRSASRYFRVTDGMMSYCVACEGALDDFAARLGAGTRSRLFGGRSRLASRGELNEVLFSLGKINEFFDIFDQLHRHRWGWSTLSGHRGSFYRDWLSRVASKGSAVLSVLEWQGAPISAMVDVRLGGREYAFQSAFKAPDVKRVSPGMVHLGFRLQDAFESDLQAFELLGGEGKKEDYKSRLGAVERPMGTIHAVRSRMLAVMHRAHDLMKGPKAE